MVLKNTLLILFSLVVWAVNAQQFTTIGIEFQQYPTGTLSGITASAGWTDHHLFSVRLGYNALDHQDFGVHDDEKGGGFGGSIGYSYHFSSNYSKWMLGARTDLWFNEVDWQDNMGTNLLEGTSKVTVLQPTAMIGYVFRIKENFILTPTLAFGAEINIITKGEPVGEGAILLWGLQANYQL